MTVPIARVSLASAILSACALVASWIGRPLLGTHLMVISTFFVAFLLSVIATGSGIIGIVRLPKWHKDRRIAWIGTIIGFIFFLPTAVVATIFFLVLFSG